MMGDPGKTTTGGSKWVRTVPATGDTARLSTVANQETGGMTPEETAAMESLAQAWNQFLQLPDAPPLSDDLRDFRRSIHECQRIIAQRVVARHYPEYWRR